MNKLMLAAVTALFVSLSVMAYSEEVETDLQKNIVRLHIIANSDSITDQNVKLKVRDEILKKESKILNAKNRKDSINNVRNNLSEFEKTANETLAANGFEYTAHAEYGKFSFPRKEYENVTLPAGEYYGVRLVLGEGKGKNWWCMIYPPLCTLNGAAALDGKSDEILRESLNGQTYDIITDKSGGVEVKFKIVETVNKFKHKLNNIK